MSNIDERIVSLKFDNKSFETNISTSLASIQKLNQGLKLDGASKGIDQVSAAAHRFSLGGIQSAVENLTSRFGVMGVAGVTALSNIVNRAVNAGIQLVKSLTIDPVKAGLAEYETKLNSIQTILSNTQGDHTNLKQVTAALQQLNTYSDKTIYNFGEMARNIGTFTAAGVKLKTSVQAIKGIANLAAISGSNSQQASTAMYQLSQSLAAGKVTLQDWNSVVNAGLGGKVFQNAIIETAKVHGVAVDDIIKKQGSFRNAIQTGFITSDILTETLSKFTGDLSESQLKSMGYNEKQIAGIIKMGKTAQDAATKVKTVGQLVGTLQEAVGSGWATSFELIFGNIDEAKTLFTNVNNVLGTMIQNSAKARNRVLKDFHDLGGRTALIKGIGNSFNALLAVLKPIREAFRDIFPATTGKQLADAAKTFAKFTEGLKIGAETADKLHRTFAGVFAIFDIGRMIVVEAVKAFLSLFQGAGEGAGSFLSITASVGDFVVGIRDALKHGTLLQSFFGGIAKILSVPIHLLGQFVGLLANGLGSLDLGGAASGLGELAAKFDIFNHAGQVFSSVWSKTIDLFGRIVSVVRSFVKGIAEGTSGLGALITEGLSNIDLGSILDVLKTGLFATLVFAIKGFLKNLKGAAKIPGEGLFSKIKDSFEQLTSTLKTMQSTLKATTLLEIAIALGVLTASVVALSKIDAGALRKALTAISVMFTQLFGAMLLFQKFGGGAGFIQLSATSALLIGLATAVRILASAVKELSGLDWEALAKGLVGVGGLLVALTLFTKFSEANKGAIAQGAGLILLAVAIKLLAGAVKDFGELDSGTIAKGLISVTTILAAFAAFSRTAGNPGTIIASGVALIGIAAAMKIMASAVKDFGSMDIGTLGKGLLGVAGALVAVGIALALIPPTAPLQAAGIAIVAGALLVMSKAISSLGKLNMETIGKGLLAMAGSLAAVGIALALIPPTAPLQATGIAIVAGALLVLSKVLGTLGAMKWEAIAKGLITLGGALAIISVALIAMSGTASGAAALLIVAGALAILTPVLTTLGSMSWESIAKGLGTLAAAFIIFGAAGLLIGPVVPALIGLGIAVALLGAGMALAGVGLLAFSIGLTALGVAGAAATGAIIGIVKGLIGLLPSVGKAIGDAVIQFAKVIGASGPAILAAITAVLTALIKAVVTLTPKIIDALVTLVLKLVHALVTAVPQLVSAGFKLLNGILTGISDNIGKIVKVAADIIVKFLNALGKESPRVIDAGVKLIISFIDGVTAAVDANSAALGAAAGRLGVAIVKGMVVGISGGIGEVSKAAVNLAKGALNSAKGALGIHSPSKEFEKLGTYAVQGFANGLRGTREQINQVFSDMVGKLRDAMRNSADDVDRLQTKLEKLTSARKKDQNAIRETRAELIQAALEYNASGKALDLLTDKHKNEQAQLLRLAGIYEDTTNKLNGANDALKAAIQLRDDYARGVSNSYDVLPDFTNQDATLGDSLADLQKKNDDLIKYRQTLQQLRDMGLSDELYKNLVDKGTAAQKFATDLLAAGKDQIEVFNNLAESLSKSADALGKRAAKELYQSGVDAAKGLRDGLKSQLKNLSDVMDSLADALVQAINKKLKIKSPSRVFAEIGGYSVQGLVNGLNDSAALVGVAGENVGKAAILGMSKTISGLSELVAGIDATPTITPVIDLTGAKKAASDLNSMLSGKSVQIDSAYSAATDASRGFDANQAATSEAAATAGDTVNEFNQYNSSPKALSESEIYRNTKNLLSVKKGGLK